jgi:hypothetical protein
MDDWNVGDRFTHGDSSTVFAITKLTQRKVHFVALGERVHRRISRHDFTMTARPVADYVADREEVLEYARCIEDLNRRVCELTTALEQIADAGPLGGAWCIATARVALGWPDVEATGAESKPDAVAVDPVAEAQD